MLGDIRTPEDVERERRSVTMLPTGAPAYNREEALAVLEALAVARARHLSVLDTEGRTVLGVLPGETKRLE